MRKKDTIIIELRGVDFVNKGGELMLHAMLLKIRLEMPGTLFVMETSENSPRRKHLELGIFTKPNFRKFKISFKFIFGCIPLSLRRKWRFITEGEINIVLDASGFAFGDIWGEEKAFKRLGSNIEKWKRQHKKIILMPQAFGPFSDSALVAVMKTIIKCTDLIFVRDTASLNYLEQLDGCNKKFIKAPDFTNLIESKIPPNFNYAGYEVAIIVNNKMMETATDKDGEGYMNLVKRMVLMIELHGYRPYFLIHEGARDRRVADMVNDKLTQKLRVVEEENPLYVKGIISMSKAVITSRFHGLVSCLSQGIPCLATGWSHKYEMLLAEYNYTEGLVDINCNDELLLAKIKSVLLNPSRYPIIEKLRQEALKQKHRSEAMWQDIFSTINKKHYRQDRLEYLAEPLTTGPVFVKNI